MRILYLDLVGGIAGDMTVAALIELGVPTDYLRTGLDALGVAGLTIETGREQRHHIAGTRFHVRVDEHGVAPERGAGHEAHPHDHGHAHGAGHAHAHRAYADIRALLERSTLPDGARDRAQHMFRVLAEAEGAVHDVPPDDVTFHEVGAWDSIADLVCTALALDYLRPAAVYCSPVPLGHGTVQTAHGTMPVPTPATARLLTGFDVTHGGPAFERTTPTGAAVLAATAQPAPRNLMYTLERVGVGLGSREEPEVPNMLRAVLGNAGSQLAGREHIECAETNLDDASPEWLGFLMERLMEGGALDVVFLPAHMKKNRPGTLVQVLYQPDRRETVLDVLFSETSTLGVRWHSLERVFLEREAATVSTSWGEVAGKVTRYGATERFSPEFDACRRIAVTYGVPLPEVYRAAERAFHEPQ